MYSKCNVAVEDFSWDSHRLKKISSWEDVSNVVSGKIQSNTTGVCEVAHIFVKTRTHIYTCTCGEPPGGTHHTSLTWSHFLQSTWKEEDVCVEGDFLLYICFI